MIHQIKYWLETTYLLPNFTKLSRFLVDHQAVVRQLGADHPMVGAEEVVLLRQRKDGVDLGLYLKPALLLEPAEESLISRTHRWMTVTEGISHLLLLHYKIQEGKTVSHLEMELQAEIDKYLFIRLNCPQLLPHHHLRKAVNLPRMNAERRRTYEHAQRLANRYCDRLERNYLAHGCRDLLLRELRQFYRQSHWDKLKFLGEP